MHPGQKAACGAIVMRYFLYLAVLLLMTCVPAAADTGAAITDIKVVPLTQEITPIPSMTSDGRDGKIIKAWRENGNAQAYNLFLVTADGKVVGVATDRGFADNIRDEPHTGKDAVESIRFAWGRVGGEKAFLLITATRIIAPDYGPGDPSQVIFDIYQLTGNGDLGKTGDFFMRIHEFNADKKYCNSDLALTKNLGLPLPQPFEGPNQDDGCL